jgi:hypothetical protein
MSSVSGLNASPSSAIFLPTSEPRCFCSLLMTRRFCSVQAHALGDLEHVGAGLLAHVGDLVDETDLRRQERVGRELDHLGAGDVHADELAGSLAAVLGGQQGPVQVGDRVTGPVTVVADHDTVGREEVHDRRALFQELRARHVAEALLALLGEDALDARARPHRHRRLHDERVPVGRRHGVDDRVHGREVGVAGVRGRRADGDEQQPRVLQRLGQVGRKRHPLTVPGHHLGQPGFVDRDLTLLEAGDLAGVDVDADDVGPELGKPRRGDEADVARADHADRFTRSVHAARKATDRRGSGTSRCRASAGWSGAG